VLTTGVPRIEAEGLSSSSSPCGTELMSRMGWQISVAPVSNCTMHATTNGLRNNWVYFLPAWLHAMILPIALAPVYEYCNKAESCFVSIYLLVLLVAWGVGVIPVWKRRMAAPSAMACILWPQAPYAIYSIATMSG